MQVIPTWRLKAVTGLAIVAAIGLIAGCGESPTDTFEGWNGQVPEMSFDLAAPDGGTTKNSDAPYFGDRYFATYLNEDLDAEVNDPLATNTLTAAEDRPQASVMFVRVLWGNLHRGPEASDEPYSGPITDWTGNAEVSDGALFPLRILRFERGDYLIPRWRDPNPDIQKVSWVSHTGPGKDGILLKILVPAPSDTPRFGNGDGLTPDDVFTFTTGPLTVSIPLSEIADLDRVITVDDNNAVSFLGFDREDLDDLCLRGSMEGLWVRVRDDDRQGGFFRAAWIGPLGHLIGHVRGRWGVMDGEKVFVGKIIRRDGSFYAHIRGNWEPNPDQPGTGTFEGRFGVDGQALGGTRGRWAVSPRLEHGGFLRGVWKRFCDRDGQTL